MVCEIHRHKVNTYRCKDCGATFSRDESYTQPDTLDGMISQALLGILFRLTCPHTCPDTCPECGSQNVHKDTLLDKLSGLFRTCPKCGRREVFKDKTCCHKCGSR